MSEEKNQSLSLDKTLYFTSLKNSVFDYSLPIKKNITKFSSENRIEASPYLFEYLCYKIAEKKITQIKQINEEISIISEKYLSSEISNKSESIKKKYVFVPIRNSISRKWNAVIFIHLEKQITQYMNQINEEPIIAKIISSNINSEEDDYILNTTMDRIESTFNFSSPEDIQFEVDSINISDQPNTSIFLLNFIEGLIEQKTDEDIMNYIMKLYDESSNTNIIGSNNYFMSFNKDNELFKDILQIYEKELEEYIRINGVNNTGNKNEEGKLFKLEGNEEEIDSEEEALKIIAKENEEIRKQMEEQEIVFNMKINDPNYRLENDEYKKRNNILGQIQEVENESEDESEKKSNLNSLKLSKSLKKRNDNNNAFNDEKIKNSVKENLIDLKDFDNLKSSENSNLGEYNNNSRNVNKEKNNNEPILNKEESIELKNINIDNNKNEDKNKENDEPNIKSDDSNEIKEENIIIVNSYNSNNNTNINKDNKPEENINKEKEEKENNNNNEINVNKENNNVVSSLENNENNDNNKINNEDNNNNNNENINNNEDNKENHNEIKKEEKDEVKDEVLKDIKKEEIIINENNESIEKKIDEPESKEIQNDKEKEKDEEKEKDKEKENISMNNIEKNENNSFEKINIPKIENKTIEMTSSEMNIKNNNIKDIHNSISDSFNSSYTNNSIYEKKKIHQKRNSFTKINKNPEPTDNNKNKNKYNNTNFYISKGASKNNKENDIKNNIKEINNNKKDNNNIIAQNDNKNIIFNKKKGVGKYKPNLPLVKKNIIGKSNMIKNNNKSDNNIFNEGNIDYNKFEKNTIIINESANNKTVINIIGIKNNYKSDDTKEKIIDNKKYENKNDNNNIINNQNQIWNINISNHNKINLIKNENEESEYITKIPDDGTINRVSSTLCANNTIACINNNQDKISKKKPYLTKDENEKQFKKVTNDILKNEIKDDIKQDEPKDSNNNDKSYNRYPTEEKIENDNEIISKQDEIKLDDENNIDVNMIINSNRSRIQRMTSKKRTKGNSTYGFFKDYETNECGIDFTKDLKCGCSGGPDNGCNIF